MGLVGLQTCDSRNIPDPLTLLLEDLAHTSPSRAAHTSALSSFPPQAACRVYRDETGSPGERRPCVSVNGPVSLNSHDSDLYGPPDMH